MTRTSVESSNIKSIGYEAKTRTLEVEFNTGKVYQYFNVFSDEYDALMASDSKGKYFGQFIRGRKDYKTV